MKVITHYTLAIVLFITVFFSLLVMNVISFIMLLKLNKTDEEKVTEHYYFGGYELSGL